ncbi:MAG: DUF4347 domain-containing protein [Pseudomonadota bacterium]
MIDERVDWDAGPRGAFWGPFIALHTRGEATMRCAASMVENVLAALGPGERIGALRIVDHSTHAHAELGDDLLSTATFHRFARTLDGLTPHFASDGFVHLLGCQTGLNTCLLRRLARLWGVPVFAGRGETNGFELNYGGWVRVCPEGRFQGGVGWPRHA